MRELQESVMRVRMLPISFVFSRFPRMVRDLSQRLGKQVELKMTGEQTELDKTVLEKIGDPLVHLVRNSIDHGIEKPRRARRGRASRRPAHLARCVSPGRQHRRGSGRRRRRPGTRSASSPRRARAASSARTKCSPTSRSCELIFMPGFSTAEQTTDISGRGVGMDVVRRNIKELGGTHRSAARPWAAARASSSRCR